MDEPSHGCRATLRVSSNLSADGASQIQRAVAPGCANWRACRRQQECTPERGGSAGYALVLKRQQRRLQQVFVRIVERHPALELGPAAAHDEQPIAVDRGWPGVGVARAGAGAMGEHETAQVSIDTTHRVASRSTGMNGTRPSANGKGMISCTCPYPLVKSIRLNGDGREAPLPLDCGHFRDPIVCPRRNGLALAAEHVRLVSLAE